MKRYFAVILVLLFVFSAASSFAIWHRKGGHRAHHMYNKHHRMPKHHY